MQSVAACAYCRDELNAGAQVCKSCGRRQPASPEVVERRGRAIMGWAAALLATSTVALAAYAWIEQINARQNAIYFAVNRARFCNSRESDSAIAQRVTALHQTGHSWEEAMNAASDEACPPRTDLHDLP
jgi:hypothetical protein